PGADIFMGLKNRIQPIVLAAIETKGQVAIAEEVRNQGLVAQVVAAVNSALHASILPRKELLKDPAAVPSFVLAKDVASAQKILEIARQQNSAIPQMEVQSLPMFDHMALFYQEFAEVDSSQFREAPTYQ